MTSGSIAVFQVLSSGVTLRACYDGVATFSQCLKTGSLYSLGGGAYASALYVLVCSPDGKEIETLRTMSPKMVTSTLKNIALGIVNTCTIYTLDKLIPVYRLGLVCGWIASSVLLSDTCGFVWESSSSFCYPSAGEDLFRLLQNGCPIPPTKIEDDWVEISLDDVYSTKIDEPENVYDAFLTKGRF